MQHIYTKWRIPSSAFLFLIALVPNAAFAQIVPQNSSKALKEGITCLNEEEFILANDFFTQALYLAKAEKDTANLVESYYQLALTKFWQANYQAANEDLYLLLHEYPQKLNRIDSMAILRLVSQNHFYTGNYDLAHEIALNRLKATEMVQDSYNLGLSYQVLSEIEVRQKDYKSALEHLKHSTVIFEKLNLPSELSFNMDLMGDIYHNTGKYEEALASKIKSCDIIDTAKSAYNNAYCNYTIALTLSKLGRYDEAIKLFKIALATFVKADLPEEIALTRACLGETMASSGQCSKGIDLIEEALKEAEKLSMSPLRRDVLGKLVEANKHCKLMEAAFLFQERYMAVNDSLNNQNTRVHIASLTNDYQLKKKSAELELLKQKEQNNMHYIISLVTGVLLLLGFTAFILHLLKKQQGYSEQLQVKTKQIAQQYDDIHRTNEKLKDANKELEQFAYLASHDLKAPLRTIGNYASLINRRYSNQLDQDGIAFLKFITEAARHMNNLLEDIFTYSKLDKTEMKWYQVDLQEKLDLSLELLREFIEEKGALIHTNERLPVVEGNPTQLYQLIQNLLDNALKFVPEGRRPEVSIQASNGDGFYHFQFKDNGIGVPPNKQEEVFTIFKRLHSKEEYKGTGIGLAICKKIVEAHGGRIWIESDGVMGTTYHFTLRKSAAPKAA
ncbi:MAG: tetratricopeptide repeat protein [Saprospiraceae bacterium]|nr:tetratricopeptide repeat protein [Saprospiraceae bacterium]